MCRACVLRLKFLQAVQYTMYEPYRTLSRHESLSYQDSYQSQISIELVLHTQDTPNCKIIVLPLLGQLVTYGLLVQLGLLLKLGFLPQLTLLHNVEGLLRPGEPRLHLSAIQVHIGLLLHVGLLLQLGFLPQLMFLHDVGSLLGPGEPRLHLSIIPIHYWTPSATRTPSPSRTQVSKIILLGSSIP